MGTKIFDLYFMDHGELKEESGRLNHLLTQEKDKFSDVESRIIELSKNLEEMKAELEKQKTIKEMNISLGKKKEMEEEKFSQQSSNELQVEKDKNKSLQEELNTIQNSYQELNLKFEPDILAAKQQFEGLQHELATEKKSHADKVSYNEQLLNNLRAEQEALRRQMLQDRTTLQQTSQEKQNRLQSEMDHIKGSYQELSLMYENDLFISKTRGRKITTRY